MTVAVGATTVSCSSCGWGFPTLGDCFLSGGLNLCLLCGGLNLRSESLSPLRSESLSECLSSESLSLSQSLSPLSSESPL